MRPPVPLMVRSEFSFLNGASRLEELVKVAAQLGYDTLALTDVDHLCGVPEFLGLCKRHGVRPILGVELTLNTGRIIALAKSRKGFASLCRLLTQSHLENERRQPKLHEGRLLDDAEDMILIAGGNDAPLVSWVYQRRMEKAEAWLRGVRDRLSADFFVRIERTFQPMQQEFNAHLTALCSDLNIPVVACNPVHYARPDQYRIFDLLSCIRNLIKLDDPHPERPINGFGYLQSPTAFTRLFEDMPQALEMTHVIADRCEDYSLNDEAYRPRFGSISEDASIRKLCQLAEAGARRKYGTIDDELDKRIKYELSVITDLGFAGYFLIVHDLLTFARSKGVRYAGRGSSADSVVAYCLDITKVDAFKRNLRFERFINPERKESLPDIDIDFDRRYREAIVQYVIGKYGQEHVAGVASFNRYRARGAIRDVANAIGFETEDIDKLARYSHWALSAKRIASTLDSRPEIRSLKVDRKKFELLFELCAGLDDMPRHISAHPCGVMITGAPVQGITPLLRAANGMLISHYDKDGVEDLGLVKFDLLSLPTLGVVEDTAVMVRRHSPKFEYDQIPLDDEETFELLRSGETTGGFQNESPAQQSLAPRLQARTIEDVIAAVALIRPGPLKGEMIEPFVRRRNGTEPVASIHPVIDKILEHTYGVVLYQEQVISIAVELAGFTPGQADVLRRTISHNRSYEKMAELGEQFVKQAIERGVEPELAEKVFTWIQGYAGYGFCEAHAASFGDTSYKTAYLLKHHPAEFYASLLNHQPMGFFPAATLMNEARRRGIVVYGPDCNSSGASTTVQNGTIRIGLLQISGMKEAEAGKIVAAAPYLSWGDFVRRVRLNRDLLENLVLSGAFDSLHKNRKELLFSLGTILPPAETGRLVLALDLEPVISRRPDFDAFTRSMQEHRVLGFSPDRHIISFWRESLAKRGIQTCRDVKTNQDSKAVLSAAGVVIRPHTPPTKSGKRVIFFSLEDESGLLNVTVFPDVQEKFGHLIPGQSMLVVTGRKDKRGSNGLTALHLAKIPERAGQSWHKK
ncbi:MAG: DNA polymerase III subunit alpha [Calditrichaeota bacterium]|nr:DNA polymerase III subunit alpha [Calditrichota bacterium]